MTHPSIHSLATDPNVAVALVSDTLSRTTVSDYFAESPTLNYTNIPTRLTGLSYTPDSLRNLLDALVGVSSSTFPDGNDTLACALRVDSDNPVRPTIELILSSHEAIRGGTVRHFREIWRQMLAISKLPHKRGAEREAFFQLLTVFRHTMYRYTLRKSRAEFARQMAVIDLWRSKNTSPSGHLVMELGSGDDTRLRMPLVETLFYLDRCRGAFASMREDGQEPTRLITSEQDFMNMLGSLELAKDSADKLLMNILPLRALSSRCFKSEHVLPNAFESITSLPRHVVNLLQFAANSMESLHSHTLVLTLVSPLNATLKAPCPRTKGVWAAIREYILREKGLCPLLAAPKPASQSLVVQGELSLITYLHALHFEHLEAVRTAANPFILYPAPYNYIAATVPPCTPSALWIDAYNARHARRGDGVRFDIAYDPLMRWPHSDFASCGRKRAWGWGWCPLPALPSVKDPADPHAERPRRRSMRALPEEAAEQRIVAAAWEAFARAVGAQPDIPLPLQDLAAGRMGAGAEPARRIQVVPEVAGAGPKKAWTGPPLQTRWGTAAVPPT